MIICAVIIIIIIIIIYSFLSLHGTLSLFI